jgi:macrodomain Ter protein organizer (MatP/YcbG family)
MSKKRFDLEYIVWDLLTAFYPVSKAGEVAWAKIAAKTDGTGRVLTCHLSDTIAQLTQAGYSVREVVHVNTKSDEQLLSELGIIGGELNGF